MTPIASDRELIARVLAGEREHFDGLVDKHGGTIWSTLRGHLANGEDAREVFQETWLRAFERLGTLRDPRRLRSWLLSIALNLVRQRLRRPTPRAASDEVQLARTDPSPAVLEAIEQRELEERLRLELAGLPPRQREVVDLRLNHELTHAEIAEVLDIREDASRASYYQALRRLRLRFDEA